MKHTILLILMICVVGIANLGAQSENINWDDYISDGMAQKLKRNLTNGLSPIEGGQIIKLFMSANNITSHSDFAVIMDNLTKHKEYAAKFILEVNSNFVCPHCYFQSIVGFTWEEIVMAKVASIKMQELWEIQQERAIIAEWNKNGKETMTFSRYDERNGRFHPKFVFYPKIGDILDTITIQPEEVGGWSPNEGYGDLNIPFLVYEDGWISDGFRSKIKQYGMDSICVLYPAERRFEKLDTVISVPSSNSFGVAVRTNKIRDINTSYIATVKYDKKTGKWTIKKCENKYGKLKDWFDQSHRWIGAYEQMTPKNAMGFDCYEDMVEWMSSYFNDILRDKDGNKYKIEFTFIPIGNIRYFINRCLIGEYKLKPRIQVDNME